MAKNKKTREDTERFVRMVSKKQGWALNPDPEFLSNLVDGLTVNHNRYGYYACPCREAWGEKEKDRDICCPCVYNVPDQEEHGHCFCALFLSQDFVLSGKDIKRIPERRPEELQPD
jgi:ferredoxin-thioredoxin reductase catalytic subunit